MNKMAFWKMKMSENLPGSIGSATTEKVFGEKCGVIEMILEQNNKMLELLEKQDVQNDLLMQKLNMQR